MKHQQVVVDYTVMIKSCFTCLMLAFSGYVLIRLICTIFVLPKWLQKQRELEQLEQQNQAMALKTKKFVQFLSTEKQDQGVCNEDDEVKALDDDVQALNDDVERLSVDVQGSKDDEENMDETSSEAKKDK